MAKIPLLELVDQLVAAVRTHRRRRPWARRATGWSWRPGWCNCAAPPVASGWRSRASGGQDGGSSSGIACPGVGEIQALAAWLDRRPHLGCDVFTRGQPSEEFDLSGEGGPEIDVIEFLWASMALFDDGGPGPDVSETWRPRWRDLYSIPEARARIWNVWRGADGLPLEQLLPEDSATAGISAEPR